jgi:hypothetical protein
MRPRREIIIEQEWVDLVIVNESGEAEMDG